MDFSDYSSEIIVVKHIINKLFANSFLHNITHDNYYKTIIKQGSTRIQQLGDLVFSVKALFKIPTVMNSEGVNITEKHIQGFLEEKSDLISRTEVCKGNIKIFLNKPFILCMVLTQITYETWNMDILSNSKIILNMPMKEEWQSLDCYRCYLVSNYLRRIFELCGASVQVTESEVYFSSRKDSAFVDLENCIGNTLSKNIIHFKVTSKYIPGEEEKAVVLCSSVVNKEGGSKLKVKPKELSWILREELRKASEHKSHVMNADEMHDYLDALAQGCLALQLMAVNHLTSIKVDVGSDSQNSRAAAFVLYNHARLCNLFRNLGSLIEKEVIPSLPEASNVDFSLLKHAEEWDLFWIYIQRYPALLQDISEEIMRKALDKERKTGRPASFPTHTIYNFLHNLCHCFSVYYSRIHILPSNQSSKLASHLAPVLYARIYLLKALHSIMKSCLEILSLVPPSIM